MINNYAYFLFRRKAYFGRQSRSEAQATGRVLVVDECRQTGGMAEGILTALVEGCPEIKMARVAGVDTYIPLGAAANLVLVSEGDIEAAAKALVKS